ncbi:MAG TPA: AbrB family transcriptional regulator [Sporosarcina psychrophila]|uniref:AbrB family transcriptional regulator n=1 Tax=Sporosarcina psychrophila TaxID=1476 RepID=A0A921G3W0_SPOPS|nr:AbrB family transcriptional regulator [Sporosarcina psychrophila]
MVMNEDQGSPRFQTRKITQIGNSYGMTLSREMLDYLKITKGDDVQVEMKAGELILRRIQHTVYPDGISEDFFDVLNETIEKYDTALKELKDR